MGAKGIFWIVGLGLLASGCSVFSTAAHVVSTRVKETAEACLERQRNQAWARAAWLEVLSTAPGPFSEDYARGFEEGFAEHLYRGTTCPPPVPPESYRCLRYQTPAGYLAIEDWFAGYRHGVQVAYGGGYRGYVTGPSSLRAVMPPHPVGYFAASGSNQAPAVAATPAREPEQAGEKTLYIQVEWPRLKWW